MELLHSLNNQDPFFWFYAVFVTIFGLCIGSFLNVVALRSLWNEDFIIQPSRCPKCKRNLNWWNNIPVLSFIFQGGKCQFCKCKISPQYPIVESICAVLYLLTYLEFGLSLKSLFIAILIAFFILISITDFKEKVVFTFHTYPIIALGLVFNLLKLGDVTILQSLIGIATGFLFFEIAARLGYLFADSRAFGEGDTIIAMGLGAFFGWKILLLIIVMSIIFQTVVTIPLMFLRALRAKDYKMCTALVSIVLSVILLKVFEYFNFYSSSVKIIPGLIFIFALLLWCIKVILGSMKNKKKEDLFYLPFGPSLVICATLVVFMGNVIKF